MTETATTARRPASIDARGSFCPGPLMELIRGIREAEVGDVLAVWSTDTGSRTDIPKWVEKAGHGLVGVVQPRRLRRDRRREGLRWRHEAVVILGGGVGGTLTANLLARKLGPDRRRRGDVPSSTRPAARLPAGLHVHRDGRRAGREAVNAPSERCSTHRVALVVGSVSGDRHGRRRPSTWPTASALAYDQLVIATGSRILPEEIEHFDDGGPPLLHGGGGAAAARARSTRSRAAGSSSASRRCRTSARRRRSRSRSSSRPSSASAGLRDRTELHFCSPISRAFTIESVSARWRRRSSRRRGSSSQVLQRRADRPGAQGRAEPRGRGAARTTC